MKRLLVLSAMLVPLALSSSIPAAPAPPPGDRTLSPYFFVKSDDPALDQLPLKSTAADVDIVGVIARVKVTQVYRNEGRRSIEAIYVFPGSTHAAVHGMKMTIGERTITAKIEEREAARRQYEVARQAGQTASLLEQQRPNVFQMNVANILPGDEIKVELVYTELLIPNGGVYEFVFPTVVGPRYTRATETEETTPAARRWTENPYLRQGETTTTAFRFAARIAAGMPLAQLLCPSHDAKIDFAAQSKATVSLDPNDKAAGNRDVVLRYRLADNRIETGLLLGEGADEKFFMCLVEPPARFASAAIPPREYVLIMDVSGSMHGFPIDTSKALLRNLFGRLRTTDYFNVLFFSGGSYVLSPVSLQATDANKATALQAIERQQGGGGTELLPALERAFDLPRARADVARAIVIATDGYVSVEREAFTLIRQHLNDANVFAFGIGSSVNRHLIEGMARVGEGLPFVVLNPGEAQSTADRFVHYIESPLLTHAEIATPGFDAYDLEPSHLPDLFAERPLVIVGKYRGQPAGSIVITGETGQGRFERRIAVGEVAAAAGNHVIRYLWARERVALLSDFASLPGPGGDGRQEIVALGLKYTLLTEFTSFVAIDQRVRRTDGQLETVKQPLPLPQGVSDLAIGGGSLQMRAVAESVVMPAKAAPLAAGAVVDSLAFLRPDARSQQPGRAPSLRVDVVENRLQTRVAVSRAELNAALGRALAGVNACAANTVGINGHRLKIFFDGKGRATRVELAQPDSSRAATAMLACVQAAVRSGLVLPWPAAGYVIVRVQ